MSDSAEDRTLPGSARRRAEALAEGHVPHSPQLGTAVMLGAFSVYAAITGSGLIEQAALWLRSRWLSVNSATAVSSDLVDQVRDSFWAGIGLVGGLVLVAFTSVVVGELLQNGLRLRVANGLLDPSRFAAGAERIRRGVSPTALLGELLRWMLPLILFAGLIVSRWSSLSQLMHAPPAAIPELAGGLLSSLSTRLGAALLALAGLNYLWTRWRWEQSLRMTPEEQREEQLRDRRRVPPK